MFLRVEGKIKSSELNTAKACLINSDLFAMLVGYNIRLVHECMGMSAYYQIDVFGVFCYQGVTDCGVLITIAQVR